MALWIVNLIGPPLAGKSVTLVFFIVFVALQIWLGMKGNEMTAKNYLENGWLFANGESDTVHLAKNKWGVAI